MKKNFLIALCLSGLFAAPIFGQFVPQGLNYQTVLRNTAGTAIANQTVVLLFVIKSGAPNGPVAYAEKQIATTNELGLINLAIGIGGTPLQGDFSTINWGGGSKFLTVSVESAPNIFDELGTQQLMSVPYALYALNAGNSGGGTGDNWGNQSVQTDPTLTGNGTSPSLLGLASQGAQPGQVLKWDGTKWAPSDDISDAGTAGGTVTQINTGAGLTGGPITVDGTISLANTGVTPGTWGSASQIPVITVDAQGRVTNVFTVVPSPGTIGITGNAGIAVQQNGFNFTISNTGDTNAFDDVNVGTNAGGDVSGTFSNLQINPNAIATNEISNQGILGIDINQMDAAIGEVLKWNGSSWEPQPDNAGTATVGINAGQGISVTGTSPFFTVSNTGDLNAGDDLTINSPADGDVSGNFFNLQIKNSAVGSQEVQDGSLISNDLANGAVTANKLANMGAANGQVLKWSAANGTWIPQNDDSGAGAVNVTAGAGISVTPNGNSVIITNTGDTNVNDDIINSSTANGDVTGIYSNLQIKIGVVGSLEIGDGNVETIDIANGAITSAKLDDMNALPGEVLKWNGSSWVPAPDQTGGGGGTTTNVVAGAGISVNTVGNTSTVTNTGDTNAADDITTSSNAGGDVSGPFSNLQIVANAVGNNELANAAVTGPKIAQMNATVGQVLKWNGTTWAAGPDNGGGAGGGDNWGTQTVETDVTLAGNGTTLNRLKLAQQGAANGQVLKWNGTAWAPANDAGGSYLAGTGISLINGPNGTTINNTGDLSNTNEIQAITLTGNTLNLSNGGGSVTLPSGTGNTYAAGTGISITGTSPNFTINNTGDLSSTNEIQTLSLNGNTLGISGGNTVNLAGLGGGGGNFWAQNGNNINNSNIGNVGINTSTPAVRLHVQGNNEILRLQGQTPLLGFLNQTPSAALGVSGYLQQQANAFLIGTNDTMPIMFAPNGTAALAATRAGNVGIGTKDPGRYQLKVFHGDAGLNLENRFSGRDWEFWVSPNGQLTLFNDQLPVGAAAGFFAINGVYTASDRSLKKDIEPMAATLDKLLRIKPVSYRYLSQKPSEAASVGFLAQDVEAVFPELVQHADTPNGPGNLAINYAGFGVLAVKAIQEQQAQIQSLKNENNALKTRLENLEARLLKLENE